MDRRYRVNVRIKVIYVCIITLFVCVFIFMNISFKRSRKILIAQEAGIISQYMNRNEVALEDVADSIRKLSAASSTNKQVAVLLNETYGENVYSSENLDRIRAVEETLSFYRNIFFDYRLHYIILGADGTVYSVTDGIDNNTYFGEVFSRSVRNQDWYSDFIRGDQVSRWVAPCTYNREGEFGTDKSDETFMLFVRKIRDYNTQKFLGLSFVSFPTENLSQILIPYEGASLGLFNQNGQLIYTNGDSHIFTDAAVGKMEQGMRGKSGYFYYAAGGTGYLVNYGVMDGTGWRLVNMVPLAKITKSVDGLYRMAFLMMIFIAIGASAICLAMYIYINAPLNRLIRKVSSVNLGGARISDVKEVRALGKTAFGIAEAEKGIGSMVDYIEKLWTQTLHQKEIEQNLRYEMLRAQLNPHFLFNTLNVIKWSAIISGAGNIGDMITSLGILLESSMNKSGEEATLKEEVRVVKAWLEIKNWALKNRIAIHVDLPGELENFKVIRFFMQPLVENAVLHGMGNKENGIIWICAREYDHHVCVTIEDNGAGMDRDKLDEIIGEMDASCKKRHVTGIGLSSIHELMKIKYGSDYGIHIDSVPGEGTRVYAVFPVFSGEGTGEYGGFSGEVKGHAEDSDCG